MDFVMQEEQRGRTRSSVGGVSCFSDGIATDGGFQKLCNNVNRNYRAGGGRWKDGDNCVVPRITTYP